LSSERVSDIVGALLGVWNETSDMIPKPSLFCGVCRLRIGSKRSRDSGTTARGLAEP